MVVLQPIRGGMSMIGYTGLVLRGHSVGRLKLPREQKRVGVPAGGGGLLDVQAPVGEKESGVGHPLAQLVLLGAQAHLPGEQPGKVAAREPGLSISPALRTSRDRMTWTREEQSPRRKSPWLSRCSRSFPLPLRLPQGGNPQPLCRLGWESDGEAIAGRWHCGGKRAWPIMS